MAREGYSFKTFCLAGKKSEQMENSRSRQDIEINIAVCFLRDGKLGSVVT